MKSTNPPFASLSATSTRTRASKLRVVSSSLVDKEKDQERDKLKPRSADSRSSRTKTKLRVQPKLSSKSSMTTQVVKDEDTFYVFIFIGASADVAKRKTYPSMWSLFKTGSLPRRLHLIGFSKSLMSKSELRTRCQKYMSIAYNEHEMYEEFWKLNNFYVGSYQTRFDYDNLNKEMNNIESVSNSSNRVFYISLIGLPAESIFQNIKTMSQGKPGWTRIVIEKPFGKNAASYEKTAQQLASCFREDEIYRVDQFLGRDIVRNILPFRFCNLLFSSSWNRKVIHDVMVTITETSGVQGKGKYFDSYGIIKEVMQMHMLQLISLIAMEKPVSVSSDDIRDEKVKLLKCVQPVELEDVVLGQYEGDPNAADGTESKIGYKDDPDVEPDSVTPTFCTAILKIRNERWDGVPFILTCGKAMDDSKSEIRIRYRDIPADIYGTKECHNELVIAIEPEESLFIEAITKLPSSAEGGPVNATRIPLDCTSPTPSVHTNSSHEYNNILSDVFKGSQTFFVRAEEISQGWRIFTPLFNQLEDNKQPPENYLFGSKGPTSALELIKKHSCVHEAK